MVRKLLVTLIAALLLGAMPVKAMAVGELDVPGIEQADDQNIIINVSQTTVIVSGANGYTLEVVSLTGRLMQTVAIDSPSQRIELNNIPKGCYILKVGKVVRKISIR